MKAEASLGGNGALVPGCRKFTIRLGWYFVLIVALTTGGWSQTIPPDTAKIGEVQRGQRRLARAVWWGFNTTDITQSLQAAINSPADTIQVSYTGALWKTDQISIPSNKVVLFDNGVVVSAKPGGIQGIYDHLFRLSNVSNIALVGYGAELRMRKDDYTRSPYQRSEWRHIIGLYGCRNVKIWGFRLANSGGDGICVENHRMFLNYSDSVHIKDVVADSNYRQGISIIAARNLLIEHSRFINTSGTAPQDGIDFEPYEASQPLQNITVRDCHFEGNAFFGIDLFVGLYRRGSPSVSIIVENCTSQGNSVGAFRVFGPETQSFQGPLGFIHVTNSTLTGEVRTRDNWAGSIEVLIQQTSLVPGDGSGKPSGYVLDQNRPNPFNPSTVIRYSIPADGHVTLNVYDVNGSEVATLVNEAKSAGAYEVNFEAVSSDGRPLASGIYFYRVQSGNYSETKKMVLLK